MEITRHKRRILLVQAIFLWEGQDQKNSTEEKILRYVWDNFSGSSYDESSADFDQERFFGMTKKLKSLRKTLTDSAPDWPLEKIASHDRAVLYLGIYELLHTDVPPAVIINESVELSKEFGGDRSSKFINGVLSTINKQKK